MLFDDEEQLEVRHVISLAHHDISIYSGGDVTPEGELFIKRNALCLSRRTLAADGPDGQTTKPFYLFSENCSAKEDFYFALLRNQEQTFGATLEAPRPKSFDVKHIISLVQKLHASEDNMHTRWLNAMLGRIFLGVYTSRDLETFIRDKITKKISRVKRPSFLTNINIRTIDTGEAAPYFTNMKLKDLNVEGECMTEADVKYSGNFRLEVSATAKIDLGPRFKAREVTLVLAVVVKRLEGHLLFKIKPPPSNRVWFSFQTMPKMELAIEPIVSSRQITYTVILRQIENRIKEVIAETLVLPFWDDIPFFATEHKRWRGGIFEGDDAVISSSDPDTVAAHSGDVDSVDHIEGNADLIAETRPLEKSQSVPITESQPAPTGLFGRKLAKPANNPVAFASSTSVDAKGSPGVSSPKIINPNTEPVIGTDSAHADIFKPSTSPPDHATNYMAALHSRSLDASPSGTPSTSPGKPMRLHHQQSFSSSSSADNADGEKDGTQETTPVATGRRNTTSSLGSSSIEEGKEPQSPSTASMKSFASQTGSLGRNFFMRRENSNASLAASTASGDTQNSAQKKTALASVSNAAAQARQWGWNAIQRQKEARKNNENPAPLDLSQPMGRGQPLPPPGTPLPGPTNGSTRIAPIPVPKRKPVSASPPPLPERPPAQPTNGDQSSGSSHTTLPPQSRRRRGASQDEHADIDEPGMLVVEAPNDSQPGTPAADQKNPLETWQEHPNAYVEDVSVEREEIVSEKEEPVMGEAESGKDVSLLQVDAAIDPIPGEEPYKGSPLVAIPVAAASDVDVDEDDDGYAGWLDNDVEDAPETVAEKTAPATVEAVTQASR
jgi:hypothetical protein